ncbi:21355_t:CDS:2 [Dentiscutata erythropus]|uniref:21355_t:CDS:1 n=1 Tax=Dentiscutata erythropus TaxID=1348616 RepID=A0A9N9C2W8_9GLOM|nr:21355_t:CDS:2 [Dentiscutata erythropus]
MSASEDIGPLISHCLVTYKNSFYIFGGTIGCNIFALTNFFHYATPPFSQGKISWQPLSTQNVKSVTDPGCIVDETRGLFFVIGGRDYLNNTFPGLQVYDFNTQRWNDPLYTQNFIPSDLTTDFWGPRVAWLQPGLIFMWGANMTTQGAYLLDINVNPWQWTILSDNKSNIVPTKCAGVVTVKGNAFVFGGFHEKDFSINQTTYIYSSKYGFMIPQFQLPVPFHFGVIGILNNKLSIIMMGNGGTVMEAVNFDLKTFQFGDVISAPHHLFKTLQQLGIMDMELNFPGLTPYLQPLLDTWISYNMSSQKWETTFNDIKISNIVSDDLSLPKVNGFDINNENSVSNNNSKNSVPNDSTPHSTSDNSKSLIVAISILSSIIVIFLLVFSLIFLYLRRFINQYKEGNKFQSQLQTDEMTATRVVG